MTGVIPSEPIRKTPAGCRGFLLSKFTSHNPYHVNFRKNEHKYIRNAMIRIK